MDTRHTPGKWKWWTSNSWRRLRSDVGRGQTIDVLHPWICKDGQPDIIVSEADMALIEAAPDMLKALLTQEAADSGMFDADETMALTERAEKLRRAAIAKATGESV
jgi:hypothetical protein